MQTSDYSILFLITVSIAASNLVCLVRLSLPQSVQKRCKLPPQNPYSSGKSQGRGCRPAGVLWYNGNLLHNRVGSRSVATHRCHVIFLLMTGSKESLLPTHLSICLSVSHSPSFSHCLFLLDSFLSSHCCPACTPPPPPSSPLNTCVGSTKPNPLIWN